jgi:pilus assembly protein CpaE
LATIPQILIVDENLDSRVQLRRTVQRAQFDVCGEVGLGADAVSQAVASKPDIILLAVEEPVTRPLETAEGLANVLPETPLLFYASTDDAEAIRRGLIHGARDFLVKPVQALQLKQAVDRALEFEEKRRMRLAGQLASNQVTGTVISIVGAKGGIGKSVIAVNLSLALRMLTQRKVVLVDGDTHFGDVATMLDLEPKVTASELLANPSYIDRNKIAEFLTEDSSGMSVLATPTDTAAWEDAGPESIGNVVTTLALTHDYALVDTSGALDRHVKAVVEASTIVLMVTTGEVSSIRDTKAGLQRLSKWGVPPQKIKVILNGGGARADHLKAKELEQAVGASVFWELPRDKIIPASVQLGTPVLVGWPKSKIARSLLALAGTISGAGKDARVSEMHLAKQPDGKDHPRGSILRKIGLQKRSAER